MQTAQQATAEQDRIERHVMSHATNDAVAQGLAANEFKSVSSSSL